jgi:hypothetical protein
MIKHTLLCSNTDNFDQILGDQYVLFRKYLGSQYELWLCDYICTNNRLMLLRSPQLHNIDSLPRSTNNPIPDTQSFYFANGHRLFLFIYDKDKPNKLTIKYYDLKINCNKPSHKEDYSFNATQKLHYLIDNKLFYHDIIINIDTFESYHLIPCQNDTRIISSCNKLYAVNKNTGSCAYFTIDKNVFVIEGINLNYIEMKQNTYIFREDIVSTNDRRYSFIRKELETRKSTDINFVNGKINIKFQPKIFDGYEVDIDESMTKIDNLENLYEMLQDALNKTNPMISYDIIPDNDSYIFELRDNHKYHKMIDRYTFNKVPDEVTIDNKLDYILNKLENI